MNPIFQFRDQIGGLSTWVREELEGLYAAIQTGWGVEHNTDGTHGAVTASSIATQHWRLSGSVYTHDGSNGIAGGPLRLPAGVTFVDIIAPGAGVLNIYGIDQVGMKFGDWLFLRRARTSGSNIDLTDRSVANTTVGTEIRFESEVSVGYPTFTITGASWVPLIYSPEAGTNSVPAWVIPQFASF